MTLPHYSKTYTVWAPVAGRVMFGLLFLYASYGKIPGTESYRMAVDYSAGFWLPFPEVSIMLAFILEIIAGIALIVGWKTRIAAFLLMLYTALLTLIFHTGFADQMATGFFVSHLGLIAGLLYISVYGKQSEAVKKPILPKDSS